MTLNSYSYIRHITTKIFVATLLISTIVNCSYGQFKSTKDNLDYAVIELLQRFEDQMNTLGNQPEANVPFDKMISKQSEVFVVNVLSYVNEVSGVLPSETKQLILFNDYIKAYGNFFKKSYDPISSSGKPKAFELAIEENFDYSLRQNYKIWSIPITQTIRYKGKRRDFRKTGIISKTLWFTILVPQHHILKNTGARILRISYDKYNFHPLVPEKVGLSYQPGFENFSNDTIPTSYDYSGTAELTGSFLISGFGNSNLYMETGLGFGKLSKYLNIGNYRTSFPSIDIDNQPYTHIVDATNIIQHWKLRYFNIPLLLSLTQNYSNSTLSLVAGANLVLPSQIRGYFVDGNTEYMGEYSFDSFGTFLLRDLPNYGFTSGSVPVTQNYYHSIKPWLSGQIGVKYEYSFFKQLSLSIGAFFETSLTSPFKSSNEIFVSEQLTPFVGLNSFKSQTRGFINIGLSYQLYEPREPFFKTKDYTTNIRSAKETKAGQVQFAVHFEGDPEVLDEMPDVEYYYDCISLSTTEKALIKSGKIGFSKNGKKLKFRNASRDFRPAVLHIVKPFGYDLKATNSTDQIQVDNRELEIFIPKNQLNLINGSSLNMEVTPRKDYHLILVDMNGSNSRLADKKMAITGHITRITQDLADLVQEGVPIEFGAYNEKTKPFSTNDLNAIVNFNTIIHETTISSSGKLAEVVVKEIGNYDILARRRLSIYCFVGSLEAFRSKSLGKGLLKEYLVPLLGQTGVKEFLPYINIKIYHFGEFTSGDLIEGPFEFIQLNK
ncbi:MAG: hypothetical protein U9N86_08755 [Bacteroidota bacterium]|nr:hypothetical protein [Bacteroidota bacterium]